jgi:hypothetical protein
MSDDLVYLAKMVDQGVSPACAAVAFRRTIIAVKTQERRWDAPSPTFEF